MKPDKRTTKKNEVQDNHAYLLHHKRSWVLDEGFSSLYIKAYQSSTSQNEVIKVEEIEGKPDESSIFNVHNKSDLIKKEDSAI